MSWLQVSIWAILLMLGSWLPELRHLVEVCLPWLLRQAAQVLVLRRMWLKLRITWRVELIPCSWPLASRTIPNHLLVWHHLLVGTADQTHLHLIVLVLVRTAVIVEDSRVRRRRLHHARHRCWTLRKRQLLRLQLLLRQH